jgi:regulatory protein
MVSGKANSSSGGSGFRVSGAGKGAAGGSFGGRERRTKKPPRPLDQAALHDLALSYVARFATTGAKLEAYLARKLRERGLAEDNEGHSAKVDVPALVTRMIELGYVDDEAYARMRSRDLSERGFGARRIEQALWAAGVDEQIRADHAPDAAGRRRAAVQLARKRRFGPFGRAGDDDAGGNPLDRQRRREKAIAAMLRAGHEFAHARYICDAADIADVEQWAAEAEDQGRQDTGGDTGMDDTW